MVVGSSEGARSPRVQRGGNGSGLRLLQEQLTPSNRVVAVLAAVSTPATNGVQAEDEENRKHYQEARPARFGQRFHSAFFLASPAHCAQATGAIGRFFDRAASKHGASAVATGRLAGGIVERTTGPVRRDALHHRRSRHAATVAVIALPVVMATFGVRSPVVGSGHAAGQRQRGKHDAAKQDRHRTPHVPNVGTDLTATAG